MKAYVVVDQDTSIEAVFLKESEALRYEKGNYYVHIKTVDIKDGFTMYVRLEHYESIHDEGNRTIYSRESPYHIENRLRLYHNVCGTPILLLQCAYDAKIYNEDKFRKMFNEIKDYATYELGAGKDIETVESLLREKYDLVIK